MTCATGGGITAFAVDGSARIAILCLSALGGAWAVRRAFRLALFASQHGVLVRNYWRVYEFGWQEVTKIGLGSEIMGVLPQPTIAFGLRDGRIVRAQATPIRSGEQAAAFEALASLAPAAVEFFVTVLNERT